MTFSKAPDDPQLSEHLLSKADALIRRNRPGGVGTDAEEIPLLVDAIDDLPELTDELAAPDPQPETDLTSTQINPINFELDEEAEPLPVTPAAPTSSVREAIEAARRTMMQEMLVEQERVVQETIERTRAENKALQNRAVQAAYAQGKEEAEINHWPALQEARKEALQSAAMRMSEHLITLDAYIAQAVEGWLARELPEIISGEIDAFVYRLKEQSVSHMRATLLPDLSEKISVILDDALKPPAEDDVGSQRNEW